MAAATVVAAAADVPAATVVDRRRRRIIPKHGFGSAIGSANAAHSTFLGLNVRFS